MRSVEADVGQRGIRDARRVGGEESDRAVKRDPHVAVDAAGTGYWGGHTERATRAGRDAAWA